MIEIVQAKPEEIEDFYPFFAESIRKFFTKDYSPKTIEHLLTKTYSKDDIKSILENDGIILFAKDGGKIIGFLIQKNKEQAGVAFANWLAVDEAYRGKGIGSDLLKAWEEECLRRGVHNIWLSTENYNVGFYEKCGFTFMGVMKKGWFGADDHYLFKVIQEPKEENYLK